MMSIEVKWDFSEFFEEELVDESALDILKEVGYSWSDIVAADCTVMMSIHNDIANYLKVPVKLDIPYDQEDAVGYGVTLEELVSDYLFACFGWNVDSWVPVKV
jgi:hypothetical protein